MQQRLLRTLVVALFIICDGVAAAKLQDTGKVVARVPVGREPHEVVISSDGRYALTTNTGANSNPGNTLSLIDVATRKERRRVDPGPLYSPQGVCYQGGRVYFTAEGSRAIGACDPVTDQLHGSWGPDGTRRIIWASVAMAG